MIKETKGNLLEAETEAIVNAVNCVGVMGKGLALQFRKRFSEDYFKDYKRACQTGDLQIGKVQIYSLKSETSPKYIMNFPTKEHWREQSKIEYIKSGLESLKAEIEKREIKSIALPAIGCGLGGLDWNDVRLLIINTFGDSSNVKLLLFVPN